ncbi:unnamed protein product [Arabis nemorensis]|uniref:Uncharacterized protein n=1 Tax=Arabis nemorensis TaxID=586526 RepID=A0A565CNW2_9BRAS|nr:unnamed protein product [Arabis nemorensis]
MPQLSPSRVSCRRGTCLASCIESSCVPKRTTTHPVLCRRGKHRDASCAKEDRSRSHPVPKRIVPGRVTCQRRSCQAASRAEEDRAEEDCVGPYPVPKRIIPGRIPCRKECAVPCPVPKKSVLKSLRLY